MDASASFLTRYQVRRWGRELIPQLPFLRKRQFTFNEVVFIAANAIKPDNFNLCWHEWRANAPWNDWLQFWIYPFTAAPNHAMRTLITKDPPTSPMTTPKESHAQFRNLLCDIPFTAGNDLFIPRWNRQHVDVPYDITKGHPPPPQEKKTSASKRTSKCKVEDEIVLEKMKTVREGLANEGKCRNNGCY